MLLDVDSARGTFTQRCDGRDVESGAACGHVRRGLALDPTHGDLTPCMTPDDRRGPLVAALAVRSCPLCGSQEFLNTRLSGEEAGEPEGPEAPRHPQSLVGVEYDNTRLGTPARGRVTEHWIGHAPHPERTNQAQLIRAMQRHSALAPHAPIKERQTLKTRP
jgi:hypothetical protein